MDGPEHYREAERLLKSCQTPGERHPADAEEYPALEDGVNSIGNALAAAQVHATLALAAASALPIVARFMGDAAVVTDWGHATGFPKAGGSTYCGRVIPDTGGLRCVLADGHAGECTDEPAF